MTFHKLSDSELLQIRKELYIKAYQFLVSEYGDFDIKKVKLTPNVVSACRVAQIHKQVCAKCDRNKCKRRASLVVQPIIDTIKLEIIGFEVGGKPCSVAEQEKDKPQKEWG